MAPRTMICNLLAFTITIIAIAQVEAIRFDFEGLIDTVDGVVATVNNVVDEVDLTFLYPSPAGDGTYVRVSLIELLPEDTRILPDPKYFLFTRENPNDAITLNFKGSNLQGIREKAPNFNAGAQLNILVHGFQSSSEHPFPNEMKNAYLNQRPDTEGQLTPNVILVDWSPIAGDYFYLRAARNTKFVGNVTAQLIQSLISAGLTTVNKIHMVGHSLGAHTSGIVGKAIQAMGLGKLNRITGLDPAGPGFCINEKKRLSSRDAEFVMAIHTDGGDYCGIIHKAVNGAQLDFGQSEQMAHVDFYPNGGFYQPGCLGAIACSHGRAHELMLESITDPTAFLGYKCSSWLKYKLGYCGGKNQTVAMGELTPNNARGKYFLTTAGSYPFSLSTTNNNNKNKIN